MEPVHRENDSEDTQGTNLRDIASNGLGFQRIEVFLPGVREKLKVGESPLEIECESTNPGVALGEADSQGSGEAEAVLSEDQKDLSLNAVIRSKKYSKITDEQRRDFIDAVENNGEKIIHAAKRFNINYSSAKSILNVFKSEGRSLKKMTRKRNGKDDDSEENEDSNNPKEISENLPAKKQTEKITSEISTQTDPEGEFREGNSLLALRDRLLASKSEKRENPYSNLIIHEATRYPENLKEFSQHQLANSDLNSYISLQETPASQNSIGGGDSKYFTSASQPMLAFSNQQQYISGLQAQYYQQQPPNLYQLGNQLGLSQLQQLQETRNNQNLLLNMSYPQTAWKTSSNEDLSRAQALQPSGNNFSSMSYTGPNQAQYTINQANESQKGHLKYIQPVMYVMPPNMNQLNFGSPIYQNIQNFAPHQNTHLYYGQGQSQNQEEGQNHNPKRS